MDAKLSTPSTRHRGPGGVRPWTRRALGLLFAAGMLIQACSDNNGSTGPTFACRQGTLTESQAGSGSARLAETCTATPAPIVGDANSGAVGGITVTVAVSPGTVDIGRRASVIVVATNKNGVRLSGTHQVIVTTSVGSIDGPEGEMVDGVYRTTLFIPCGSVAATGTVAAVVDGTASITGGTFTPITPAANNPCL